VTSERILKALANRRRLAIIRHLKKHKDASVGDIAEAINLSFKATSKHLGILTAVDILEREQRNIQMFYALSNPLPPMARSSISLL
jgi:DNA-binding transcriptional ArsR family regulator